MDISTENVLMCKKAIEIQDNPKSSATMPDDVFFREIAGGEYLVGAYSEESDIWLPHMYKLQAMVKRRNELWIQLLNRFYNYYTEEVQNNHEWPLTFDTPEKMWLAFMMKEKHSKIWNGKEWECCEMTEENREIFNKLFWSYNCPLQMWPNNDGTWTVLNYMPRRERTVTLDPRVTKEELPDLCKNTSRILRNLADLFDALAAGKLNTIYYPDENVDDAILKGAANE